MPSTTIALNAQAQGSNGGALSVTTGAFSTTGTRKKLFLVGVQFRQSSPTTVSSIVNTGPAITWSRVGDVLNSGNIRLTVYYGYATSNFASDTITANLSTSQKATITVLVLDNLDETLPFGSIELNYDTGNYGDAYQPNSTATGNTSSPVADILINYTQSLIVAILATVADPTITAGTNYTLRNNIASTGGSASSKNTGADETRNSQLNPSSRAANFTLSATQQWALAAFEIKSAQTRIHTTNAQLFTPTGTFTRTHTTTGIKLLQSTKTHTTSALLLKTTTRTTTTTGLLLKTLSINHITNATLVSAAGVKITTTSGILQKTSTRATSALGLLLRTTTRTHTTNSIKSGTFSRTTTTTGSLLQTKSRTHTTLAQLRTGAIREHSTSGLKQRQTQRTITTTGILFKTTTRTWTTNAQIVSRTTLQHTTNALLQSPTQVRTHTTRAQLGTVAVYAIDTFEFSPISIERNIDIGLEENVIPKRVGSHIRPVTVARTITIDGYIKSTELDQFIDTTLKGSQVVLSLIDDEAVNCYVTSQSIRRRIENMLWFSLDLVEVS